METIEISVDGTLRADAQRVLADEGLTIPEAVAMFLRTVVHDGIMPGACKIPNDETIAAFNQAESNTLPSYTDTASFMRSLYEDD